MKRTMLLVLIGVFLLVPLWLNAADEKTVTIEFEKGVTFSLTTEKFIPEKHKIGYYDNDGNKCPGSIDGAPFFGIASCRLPKVKVKAIVLMVDGKRYSLDASFMYDPLFSEKSKGITFGKDGGKREYTVRAVFADGAATYYAEWLVFNGKAHRMVLTCDECMTAGFLGQLEDAERRKIRKEKIKSGEIIPPPRHSEE